MIRKANRDDFAKILFLYKSGLDELGIKYKESMLVDKIDKAYYCAPCFLLVIDDRVVGMAALTASFLCYDGSITLSDYMFYIEPEYRNLKRLSGLVNACKDFAKQNDVALRLDFISQNDEDLRIRLLRMHGFKINSIVGVYEPWVQKAEAQ